MLHYRKGVGTANEEGSRNVVDRWEWKIFGRTAHPYTLGVWVAITTVAAYLGIFQEDAQEYIFRSGMTAFVGAVAGLSSLLFILGFIVNRWVFLSWGLMLAAGVFIARVALYAMDIGWDAFPMWISLGLSLITIGAWLLERERHEH